MQRMAGNHTFNGKQSEYDQFYNAAQPKDYYPSYLEGGQWQAQRNGEVVTNAKYVSWPVDSVPESETVASERVPQLWWWARCTRALNTPSL
jgi:hypothetical protein